jgi:hypothetical protein
MRIEAVIGKCALELHFYGVVKVLKTCLDDEMFFSYICGYGCCLLLLIKHLNCSPKSTFSFYSSLRLIEFQSLI